MRVVVIISADAEWRAVRPLFPNAEIQTSPYGEFFLAALNLQPVTIFHGGWGKISAAASAQYVADNFHPDIIVNLGTCGGFEGRVERGEIILVERTLVYDIIEQMEDPDEVIAYYATDLDLGWLPSPEPHPVRRGLLLSGDRDILPDDIPTLIEKYDAFAADWESASIAWVARKNGLRCLILRGVSDLVGAGGGEAYGDVSLFHERTKEIMARLIRQLPDWLPGIE
ncbi:MAG: 5'-methylthioadenosine/S-adenosylhomocysteine nucleosidase [Chloroflexi bacterium]|nr:5'-methylthioadenosine/S-adenosylhomocysteine nucleosidase [Chloroflexota bacterium]